MLREKFFSDKAELLNALQAHCLSVLGDAISDLGRASFLLSGGSTPQVLYEALSESELDWANVDLALVDERWVANDHAASNEAMIRRSLLVNKAASARVIAMKNSHDTAQAGHQRCEAAYASLKQPYDFCLLGMGSDGHFASLFPYAQGLAAGLDLDNNALCVAISARQTAVTGNCTERMSLTLSAILRAQHIVLLISGDAKRKFYERAKLSLDPKAMPVSALLKQDKTPVTVYWAP